MDTTKMPTFVEKDLNYYLRMIRGDFSEVEEAHPMKIQNPSSPKNIVILLTSEYLGTGDEKIGKRLLKAFFQSLVNNQIIPRAVILMNSAVKLALNESEVFKFLNILEEKTVKVLLCALSVDEYQLEEKIKVGVLADMDSILEHLLGAWKVIAL